MDKYSKEWCGYVEVREKQGYGGFRQITDMDHLGYGCGYDFWYP